MKNKTKGILQLLAVILVIAALGVYAYVGEVNDKVPGVRDIGLGLDLDGGLSITYETAEEKPDAEKLSMTIYRMQQRVENYSTEAQVYQRGDNRICVDIPGVDNAEKILEELGDSGNVYFILGEGESGVANIVRNSDGNFSLTRSMDEIIAAGDCILDGQDIQGAEAMYTQSQSATGGTSYFVELKLKSSGKDKFYKATTEVSQYYYASEGSDNYYKGILAIVYDGEVISAPRCEEPIDSDTATISGDFSYEEVSTVATTIQIGALPLELHQLQYSIVGAQLGSDALETILLAGIIGIILIILFMIIIYKLPGICAGISLIIYTGLVILCLIVFDVTLTLPGIAGIILSIGMAVDGNIIIFTRIKEELRAGKTVRSAIKLGYGKATSAIIDGNVTTLIAAIVLYVRGSGTIKGFAITLAIGIVLSVISSLLITRFIMNMTFNLGFTKEKHYGIMKETKVYNFTKHWVKYLIISGVMILAGFVGLIVNNASTGKILNYGLDFVGGTSVEVYFDQTPPTNSEIEELSAGVLGSTPQVVQVDGENAIIIKTDNMITQDSEDSAIAKLKSKLYDIYGVTDDKIQVESISASVSDEMKADAIWAVVIAGICMLIYIWIRFKNLAFATSSVLALLHDVLVVFMIYSVCRITVDNSFIACMLTIVGYSINATIVIFDRIRENLKARTKKQTLDDIVNLSISETLTRSINTSVTTLIAVVMIVILGVDSIREFAIPLMAGMICGAYSSVCIAGTLWLFFMKRSKKDSEQA
ncbi:MAG: protein translocase subunit SecD [Lachnospiraceae bacterium]